MKKNFILTSLFLTFFSCLQISLSAQGTDNISLNFDGQNDYVALSPLNFLGTEFTTEAWFQSTATNPGGNFRRLLVLSSPEANPSTLFEIGEIGGFLNLLITTPLYQLDLTQVYPISIRDGICHHIAVVRSNTQVRVYLDGVLQFTANGLSGASISAFYVGGGPSAGGFWEGTIDEIRVWTTARTLNEINQFKDCEIAGNFDDLQVYWTLNQDVNPGGDNTGQTTAFDFSNHNNSGSLNFFSLNGLTGNYVSSSCSPKYDLNISNIPSVPTASVAEICEGSPLHFAITENNNTVNTISGAIVEWEYKEQGVWISENSPYFSGYCFFVPQGIVLDDCDNNPQGFADRVYRAKITKTVGDQSCIYHTSEKTLRICCPITGSILLSPASPTALCQGSASVQVELVGAPFLSALPIQWYINGIYNSNYDNLTSFTYTGLASTPQLCFEAHLLQCACPPVTLSACLTVDPLPECTIIDQLSDLMQLPGGGAFDYLICPGSEASLGFFGLPQNCISVWQFSFDPSGAWTDIGTGNTILNTNVLPPKPPSVYNWPDNATCIYYRLECRPLSFPHSECPTLHSNVVTICLKQNDLLTPAITAAPNPICEEGISQICLDPPVDPMVTQIQWWCNGFPCGTGTCIYPSTPGIYQASVSDGCFTKFSNTEHLTVCDPVAILQCPEENPCACYGYSIMLDGTMSYSNCGPIINYEWEIVDGTGTTTQVGPTISYTFSEAGGTASFTLTVTDSNQCTQQSKTLTLKPCED